MAKVLTQVVRTSPFSGKENSMNMWIDPADIERYNNGAMIQQAFPYLSVDEREFFKTGITPEEWEESFG